MTAAHRPFEDRRAAGKALAARVAAHLRAAGAPGEPAVVVGLPRGGVVVADEVARALGLPLDVVIVRKLGVPWQPELAMGAVGEGGVRVLNRAIADRVDPAELEAVARIEGAELERRARAWRTRDPQDLAGRTVVVVDDGIATGATVRAAVAVLRARHAGHVLLAVPVVAAEVARALRGEVDALIALAEPNRLQAVGAWYVDFTQVEDEEVRGLLALPPPPAAPAVGTARIPTAAGPLPADVTLPAGARGVVLFAHGSGSSRLSPRNRAVAAMLTDAGLATVLLDLLTEDEAGDRRRVFDIPLLADRLAAATAWAGNEPALAGLGVGYFGASTGAAAALWAAAEQPRGLRAVVSRGGRPDLAGSRLPLVRVPTLLIVGDRDTEVLALNRAARAELRCPSELAVVPGATHLFPEPGTLEEVGALAAAWFGRHLPEPAGTAPGPPGADRVP